MAQITSVVDRTVVAIENDVGTRSNSNTNTNSNSTPTSQFASHPQHNLPTAVKQQDAFGSAAHRRPSLRSTSTIPSSMVNGTEQLSIHRAPSMSNASYYNPPMTAPTAAYSQMGYADLTQSALSTPTSASSSMQSSYIPAATEESAHHQYLYTTSAAASAAAAAQMNHTPPGNSPQSATATHNPMMAYNNPQQAATTAQTHPHPQQQQQQQQAPAAWMNGGPGAAVQQVPNGTNPWHEWTSAIAMGVPPSAPQDRYSAGALLTLGAEQRGPGDPGGGPGPGPGPGQGPRPGGAGGPHAAVSVPAAQGGQWSMMMTYHNPNHAGG